MSDNRHHNTRCDNSLDKLVATYAPIGERQRRKRQVRRASVAGGVLLAVAAGALLSASDSSLLDAAGRLLPRHAVATGDADSARLAREQQAFSARLAELETQLVAVQSEQEQLLTQRDELSQQSARIAALLDQTDTEESSLQGLQQQGTQLDEEIAALAAQRKALESRWVQFEKQGELLAMEIIAVNAQRKELEAQRLQIERQREKLAEMLERADGLYRNSAHSAGVDAADGAQTTAVDDNDFMATPNSLMVSHSELDDMRGGFSIGEGLDVSFGFSQTGSINGVEQFENRFTINNMGSGLQDVDMANMNSVLIQNGTGNFVSTSVIDTLADSFGNVIQNTLDDQVISTTTVYDISLQNVPGTLQGLSAEQAMLDSLGSF